MPVGVRRSELDIIYDMLKMQAGAQTTVRHSANLSHTQMLKYLAFLERNGLILLLDNGKKASHFQITEKGKLVIRQLESLNATLGLTE